MVNEPLPHQLTAGQLRESLRDVPDATVVVLVVRPSLHVEPRLTLLYNVHVSYSGGPVLRLFLVEADPAERPDVDEYRLHRLTCSCCGTTTRAELPAGVPTGPFGPRLRAILAMFAGSYRLAKRPIRQLASDLFGLDVSLGMISKLERRAGDAVGLKSAFPPPHRAGASSGSRSCFTSGSISLQIGS
jgi:hypothetical protein